MSNAIMGSSEFSRLRVSSSGGGEDFESSGQTGGTHVCSFGLGGWGPASLGLSSVFGTAGLPPSQQSSGRY